MRSRRLYGLYCRVSTLDMYSCSGGRGSVVGVDPLGEHGGLEGLRLCVSSRTSDSTHLRLSFLFTRSLHLLRLDPTNKGQPS